jgi:acetylornithine deacetylase ArgE
MDMAAAPSTHALEMARALVRINTVSRESNLPLIELIRDELARHGVASRLTFDDDRKKANLFATLGAGKPAGVIVSGHTDTVPWDGQDWSFDPLGAEVKDGRLYGRGSADMKSFIGLAVAQVPALLAADLPFAVHLAFSYDEEVGGFGARRLIADMRDAGVAPLACIVGEPTGMIPALAHKGVYRWRCCVRGHAAHSSLTPQSVNAIEVGARVVARLADMAARWRDQEPRYEGFDVPYSTGSVGVIEGGIADNVVPADCRFNYEFRNLPGSDVTGDAGRGPRLCGNARAGDARRRCRRGHPLRDDLRDAGVPRRGRRSGRAARAATRRHRRDDAGRVRHRGGPVPARRHADRRLRPGPHRAGAPGRRIRVAGPARRGRALPARADDRRRLSGAPRRLTRRRR